MLKFIYPDVFSNNNFFSNFCFHNSYFRKNTIINIDLNNFKTLA